MAPRLGLGSYIGFGEKNWDQNGAAADIKYWYEIEGNAEDLTLAHDLARFDSLTEYDNDIATRATGLGMVTGSVTFPITWRNTQNLFRFIAGQNVVAINHGNGEYSYHFGDFSYATPFFNPEPNDPAHYVYGTTERGLCIEVHRSDAGGDSVFYQGCVVTEASFGFEPNDFVKLSMSFVGRDITVGPKSTPTFETGLFGLARTATGQGPWRSGALLVGGSATGQVSVKLGNVDYRASSASFSFSQPVERRTDVSDTLQTAQPKPSGRREVTFQCEIETASGLDDDTIIKLFEEAPLTNRFLNAQVFIDEHPYTSPNAPFPDAIWGLLNPVLASRLMPRADGIGPMKIQLTLLNHTTSLAGQTFDCGWLMGIRNNQTNFV